jgi:hypothetical protein
MNLPKISAATTVRATCNNAATAVFLEGAPIAQATVLYPLNFSCSLLVHYHFYLCWGLRTGPGTRE